MPASEKTRTCPETGKRLVRGVRPVEFSYKGRTIILDQPGWYAEDDGPESLHDGDDILATEEAFQTFKADRKSVVSGKSVSVRVDLGGRRIIKNKQHNHTKLTTTQTTQYIYITTQRDNLTNTT